MMRRKVDMVFLIIFLCSLDLLLFAVWKLVGTYAEYRQGTETYEELQDYIQKPDGDKRKDTTEEHDKGVDDTENGYLHHMFDGQENKSGSIFIDCHNKPDFTDRNTIVYGHNMNDGSMFGTLERYQEQNLYQQYPCFYIYVPGTMLEYRIISCYVGRNESVGYTYSFPEAEDFQKFLNTVLSYAGYDTETEVTDSDHIVTLSTCVNTDQNYRYLVHGKLIQRIQNNGNKEK